eukprot:3577317-Rhodomonas_salina.1
MMIRVSESAARRPGLEPDRASDRDGHGPAHRAVGMELQVGIPTRVPWNPTASTRGPCVGFSRIAGAKRRLGVRSE